MSSLWAESALVDPVNNSQKMRTPRIGCKVV
jgi:hypothetical protein